MTEFTPGEFTADNKLQIRCGVFGRIASCNVFNKRISWEEKKANAVLLSCSKEMYNVLTRNLSDIKKINALISGLGYHPYTIMEAEIEEILKRARGEC